MARLPGLTGLKGLIPDPQDTADYMDEGVLEARHNDLDPEHGEYGSQSYGYSGTVPTASPFSGQAVYAGADPDPGYPGMEPPARGMPRDRTPTSHRAPWPRGIRQYSVERPDELAVAGQQLVELHSPDFGGPAVYNRQSPAGHEEETHYTTDRYDAPNENYLTADVPGQLKGNGGRSGGGYGGGNADTTQGYGVLNSNPEFKMGHSIRRVQHDHVPFDYTNTHGEQDVPFRGRHPVQQMPLDGPDSPYFDAGSIDGANIPWEGRIGDPSPYEQPSEPTIGDAPESQDVYAWLGGTMAALDGDVDVLGKKIPKKYLFYGLAGGGVIAVIAVIRERNAASTAAASDTSGSTDTADATDTSGIDPATGIPYDQENGGYGADNYGGADYGGAYDNGGGNLDAGGFPIGSQADLQWQQEEGSGITTNDQWVEEGMSDVPGSQAAIQAALVGVLAGQTVTVAQKALFMEAVALNGQPPGGYPQPIKTSDTAAQPGAGAGKVKVPNVVNESQEDAFRAITAAGFKPSGSKVVHGETLIVHSQTPKAEALASKGSTVHVVSSAPKKATVKK